MQGPRPSRSDITYDSSLQTLPRLTCDPYLAGRTWSTGATFRPSLPVCGWTRRSTLWSRSTASPDCSTPRVSTEYRTLSTEYREPGTEKEGPSTENRERIENRNWETRTGSRGPRIGKLEPRIEEKELQQCRRTCK